ncbi:hypothetical protein VO54_03891 [Elizabethkingia miricola]|nr:hypothetical protein VO54_03891 [Elizabethkingia miricola]
MNKKISFVLFLLCTLVTVVLICKWIFNTQDMQSSKGSFTQTILWPLLTVTWYINWTKAPK